MLHLGGSTDAKLAAGGEHIHRRPAGIVGACNFLVYHGLPVGLYVVQSVRTCGRPRSETLVLWNVRMFSSQQVAVQPSVVTPGHEALSVWSSSPFLFMLTASASTRSVELAAESPDAQWVYRVGE